MTAPAVEESPSFLPLCNRMSPIEELYGTMYAIRLFEESLLRLFEQGRLSGTTHTSIGQEAAAVGVVSAMRRDRDILVSGHRCHGHFLAYCGEARLLYQEVMGKPGGVCGGRGGSQHLCWENFSSNGILGGGVANAVGMALAEKQKATGAIVTTFLGDGALGQGIVYEAFNTASLWRLPVLFVIEDNGYAQSTPRALNLAGSMSARPRAFGIPVREVEGTDVRTILDVTAGIVEAVRSEMSPQCLVVNTYRLGPHSKGDDFREEGELKTAWENDSLKETRAQLDSALADKMESEMRSLLSCAELSALSAPDYDD